ncbi:hypothetical protein ACP4OV_016990 [Aristida adscensionis]
MERWPAPPPPYPSARTMAMCALLAGCVTAAVAAYCIHTQPCFIQCACSRFPELHPAALPRWLLWGSAAQAGSAALYLLLPGGPARRALAFAALAAAVACLLVLVVLVYLFSVFAAGDSWSPVAVLIGVTTGLSLPAFLLGFLAVLLGAK